MTGMTIRGLRGWGDWRRCGNGNHILNEGEAYAKIRAKRLAF